MEVLNDGTSLALRARWNMARLRRALGTAERDIASGLRPLLGRARLRRARA